MKQQFIINNYKRAGHDGNGTYINVNTLGHYERWQKQGVFVEMSGWALNDDVPYFSVSI